MTGRSIRTPASPIGQYYDIGQVANRIQSNTFNTIDVNVANGSVWTVTGDGIVNDVTAASTGIVAAAGAEDPVILRVGGTLTLDGQVIDLTPVPVKSETAAPERCPPRTGPTRLLRDNTDVSTEGEADVPAEGRSRRAR